MAKTLSDRQRSFIEYVARGLPIVSAAREAGYSTPQVAGHRLMRMPNIRENLHNRRQALIEGNLAQLAVTTMKDLMLKGPAQQRYQASRYVLDLAGHKAAERRSDDDIPLEQMTPEQLAQAVQSGIQALAEIARSLDGQHIVDGERRDVRDVIEYDKGEADDSSEYADLLD